MSSLANPFTDIHITTVGNGPFFIADLFQAKFNSTAPDYGHAVIAFFRNEHNQFLPVCYTNFLPHEDVILVGGAMTDGSVLRQIPEAVRKEIKAGGGVYFSLLKFAFDHFAGDCEAFFGYAADKRALTVDLAAGFEHTPHEHLIVHWHKPLGLWKRKRLVEKIRKIGPF
jgi:hypothetical protein